MQCCFCITYKPHQNAQSIAQRQKVINCLHFQHLLFCMNLVFERILRRIKPLSFVGEGVYVHRFRNISLELCFSWHLTMSTRFRFCCMTRNVDSQYLWVLYSVINVLYFGQRFSVHRSITVWTKWIILNALLTNSNEPIVFNSISCHSYVSDCTFWQPYW